MALLLPGWCYTKRRDTFTPAIRRSQLSEVADILVVSAVSWAVLSLVSIPFATIDNTFDEDMLSVSEVAFGNSFPDDRRLGWGVLYLALATAGTYFAAFARHPTVESDRQRRENAWRFVFKSSAPAVAELRPRVLLYLKEPGWWIRGWLDDFPGDEVEKDHRDLVLVSPIERFVSGKGLPIERVVSGKGEPIDVDYLIVNEANFSNMMVTFHQRHPRERPPGQ